MIYTPHSPAMSAKKPAAKKPASGAAPKHGPAPPAAAKKHASGAMTKTSLLSTLAAAAGITKDQASAVLEALSATALKELKSSGEFKIPGLVKLKLVSVPAKPAREMISPFTKQMIKVAAKPASKKVKAMIPKALKEAV